MLDLRARTACGAVWTYASYATGRVLVFAGIAVVARLIRPDDYGLFGMAVVGINLLEGSYDFGLRRGLICLVGSVPAVLRTGFALALGLGVALSVLLAALAPLVATFYAEPRVTDLMRVLSVYFGIACLGVVPDALLQHRLAFNRRFWPSLAAPAGRYLLAIPLAAMGFGAWSLVWGQLVGISLEVAALFALSGWRPRLGWSQPTARQLIDYSSQVSQVEWIAAVALNLDYVLVGHFLGSTVLGLYTLAFKLPDTTIGAAGWIGSRVLLPAFVELGEHEQSVARGLLEALRLLTILLGPLAAGLYLLAPQIVPLLFGERWTDAVPVVQLLAVSACLNGILQAIGAAFMATGQSRKIVMAQAAWLTVLVPSLYLAAQVSIVAVAAAHVAGMLVFAVAKVALVPSALRVSAVEIGRAAAPGLVATMLMVIVLVPVLHAASRLPEWAILATGVTVGALAYIVALLHLTRRAPRAHAGREVAMLLQSYYPRIGGAETNLQALIGPLRAVGVGVRVVTRRFPGMAAVACVADAPVYRLRVPGGQIQASLVFIASAVWLLARMRPVPDVLHAHELRSPTLAAVCAKLVLRRPVVAHVLRGGLLGDVAVLRAARLGRARLWLFRQLVDQFVAVSAETRLELLAAGVPPTRVTLVSYGVDTVRFCPADAAQRATRRRQLDLEARAVVLVVARLVPEKGFDRLLTAWPLVKTAEPSAVLIVVGDGSQRRALTRQAECLGDVRFVGELRDPQPYLQVADCFVLPSFTEGQPISLLEAMSTGVPCVGSDIGGISDALAGGQAGTLVPPGDVPRLADAIIRTLRLDATARATVGAAARQHILEHHSLAANAASLRNLYDRLV